jgi:hypothetical protein
VTRPRRALLGAVFDVRNPTKVGRRPDDVPRDLVRSETTPHLDRLGRNRADREQSREGPVNQQRDGGHTGNREDGAKARPPRRPAVIPRRMRRNLEGEQSPWKDRTSTRGNEGDVTDSSAEQGPEAGRPAWARKVRHPGNGFPHRLRTRHRRGRHITTAPRCFGTVDGTATSRRSHFGRNRGSRTSLRRGKGRPRTEVRCGGGLSGSPEHRAEGTGFR